jgi:fatty-acyl-CoA synthase
MTETSPLASIARLPADGPEDPDEQYAIRAKAGRVVPLVEFRLDEEAGGELQVSGPTIAASYYEDETGADKFTDDGWLRTGDVAEVDDGGWIRLVDRTKDLVKSGGEWISSVELENEIMAHPQVKEAAVIGIQDEKWGERPLACVVPRDGEDISADDLRGFLDGRVPKWWIPNEIELIDEVPKTSVGKFSKKDLRERFAARTGVKQ